MGIAGHILGPKKLRRLSALSGLPLNRAINRNGACVGVIWSDSGCTHYEIDGKTGAHKVIADPVHWTTCNPDNRSNL